MSINNHIKKDYN